MKRNPLIGVIGQGKDVSAFLLRQAEEVGRLIAKNGCILLSGGRGGIMEAACRGAKSEQGLTVGILPGRDSCDANEYVDIPLATGLGEARNAVIARAADALIAIGGKYGTLSEIAFALNFNKPVIGLHTWKNIDGVVHVDSPEEAVQLALDFVK